MSIKKGSTDVSRYVMIVDSSDGSPETGITVTTLDLQYTRNQTAAAAKVDATAGAVGSHSNNTVVEVDATSSPGLYKVDWPDAAFATGVDKVLLVVTGAGFAPAVEEAELVDNVVSDIVGEIDTLLYSGPRGSGVYLDDAAGNTNTVVGTDGIESNPVSTIAAATTIAGSLGIQRIYLINDSVITLAQTYEGWEFVGIGLGNQITLGSQDVDNTAFYFMTLTGTQGGTGMLWCYDCSMAGLVSLDCLAQYCYLTGTNTVRASSLIIFDQCLSAVPGNNTPELTFSGGTSAVNFRHYSGGLQINSMATGDVMSFESDGQIIVDATCTDGDLTVRGILDITDNSSGAVTITQSAAINRASINAECDTALSDIKLDHLVAVADSDDAVDDSIVAKLAAKGGTADWSDFVNTTDSLQAIRDNHLEGSTRLLSGTSTGSSTSSKVYVQAGDPPSGGTDDMYNNAQIIVYDGADKTTARVNVRAVTDYDDSDPSFTVDTALDFTPDAGDIVEVFAADAAALDALTKLATGFGSASPDTLQGYILSLMSKVASAPAAAGTFSPATDSVESLRERLDLITGGGFATGTDSLAEIRDAIDTLVAPSVVGSSALSGSGLLSDLVTLIRKATNEPLTNPKYTDGDIVELIQAAMDVVLTDVHINTDHPIIIRHSITLVSGSQDYILPPGVGEILRIAKIDTGTNLPQWEAWPGSYFNPAGHGWKVEGNVLRLLQDWLSTDTLEIMYIPSAEALMHKATASAATATTITFPASVTDGTLDTRPNAYVGMVVRILSSTQNILEERVVTAYDVATRVATLNKAWDTTPTGTIVYEVVPLFNRLIKHVVALRTSMDILSQEGNEKKIRTLERNYAVKMMAMRRSIEKRENRFPHHFDGDTWDNTMRGGFYGVPV